MGEGGGGELGEICLGRTLVNSVNSTLPLCDLTQIQNYWVSSITSWLDAQTR